MSFFDLFQAAPEQVHSCLEELRNRFPEADLEAFVADSVIVVRGMVDTAEQRQEVLEAFRGINPDLTVVVAGGLKKRQESSGGGKGRSSRAGQAMRATRRIYRVRLNETIEQIADQFYGDPRGSVLIAAANPDLLEHPGYLQAGWILEIPETFFYTTRPGDTLAALTTWLYGQDGGDGIIQQMNQEVLSGRADLEPGLSLELPLRIARAGV